MKKQLAVALVLCLLVPCAAAETVDDFLSYYEIMQKYCGGMKLDINTAMHEYSPQHAIYWKQNNDFIVLIMNGQNIEGSIVIADRSSRDFLGMCCSCLVACAEKSMSKEEYGAFLQSYFNAVTGAFMIGYFDDLTYQFTLSDTENKLDIFMKH